jgi:beta-galactosidase/beta-glucuronidase
MNERIEISVGDVNDVEARVFARYTGAEIGDVQIRGTLRGPFCAGSRTLPAVIAFRDAGEPRLAEAVVPDPCTWSPELPHVYEAEVIAMANEHLIAEYHGTIGLHRGQRISNNTADERR